MTTELTGTSAAGPSDPLGADLLRLLRTLKLSGMKDTLPARLSLARTRQLSHVNFLELLLSDEVSRRDARSATVRAALAGLAPLMRLDNWNEHDDLTYDRGLLSDLTTLRFVEAGHNALILGPVGVGKTHLANALGHIAIRRRLKFRWPAPRSCSPDCGPPDWTTPSKQNSVGLPASICS